MFVFKRNNIYYVEYYDETLKKTRRVSTKEKTRAAALKFITEQKHKLKKRAKIERISLSDFSAEYEEYSKTLYSKKYVRSISLSLRMLNEFMGDDTYLDEIKSKRLEEFVLHTFRRAKYASHLYYRTLKAAFNKAIQWDYITDNPFKQIKPPKLQKKLPIFINEAELNKINKFVNNSSLRDLFLTAFYTGLRLNELINLQWNAVDLQRKMITIGNTSDFITKSKSARIIPVSKSLLPLLQRINEKSKSQYVFSNAQRMPFNIDYVSHAFKFAVRDAHLSEQIHFHTLRHSFASGLVQKGISLYVVKELLGHSDISTTQIYAHLDNNSLRAAVDVI